MNSAGTVVTREVKTEDEAEDYIIGNDLNSSETENDSNNIEERIETVTTL